MSPPDVARESHTIVRALMAAAFVVALAWAALRPLVEMAAGAIRALLERNRRC